MLLSFQHNVVDFDILYSDRIRKLWNRKTTFYQYLSVFDVVKKQIVLAVTYQITYLILLRLGGGGCHPSLPLFFPYEMKRQLKLSNSLSFKLHSCEQRI